MKRLLIAFSIFTALAAAAIPAADGIEVSTAAEAQYLRLMERADSAISAADWFLAERLLREGMALDSANPTNILLMSNLGMVQHALGNDSTAIATLTEAHRRAPVSVTVLNNRAKVYMSCGMADEAVADFEEVCRLDSTLAEPYFYRGMLAMWQGDIATAAPLLHRLEQLAPDELSTHQALAMFYTASSDWYQAIKEYSRIIEQQPDAEYYAERARLYLLTEQLNEASTDIAEGLRLDPENGEFYLFRALLNKMRYRNDEARADALRAEQLGVDPARTRAIFTDF